jgi:hypothetical protein
MTGRRELAKVLHIVLGGAAVVAVLCGAVNAHQEAPAAPGQMILQPAP